MKLNKRIIKKLRKEIHVKNKSIHSLKKIKKWYKNVIKKSEAKVIKINLSECSNWHISKENIKHKTNKFFKVEGIRVIKSYNREVSSGWDQPILTEPNFKGGILGLIRKEINGMPHYLINAKFEPGNYKLIQLSPTVQSTFSNISRVHKGTETRLLKYFVNPNKNNCKIIFKQWFSEEGGRLKNKRNLGILINHQSNDKIIIDEDYTWVTLKQIKELILENAIVNPHLRSLVSFL
jgi:oxidase EvaA